MGLQAVGALPFGDERFDNAPASASFRLAQWFGDGARLASQSPTWRRTIEEGPKLAFVFPTRAEVLVGALRPTTSKAGRPYAFAVVEEQRDPLVRGLSAALPCADAAFFEDCLALLDACAEEKTWADVEARVHAAHPFFEDGCASIAENFMTVSAREGGVVFMHTLLGDAAAPAGVSRLFEVVRERVRNARGPRAVRLPLYSRDPRATTLVWLALIRTAARWTDHVPGLFWTNRTEQPWLQVDLNRQPDAESFASLWSDTPDPSVVADLRAVPADGSCVEAIRDCLSQPKASLGNLLTVLESL
jgi:hypothetical protein